MDSREALHKYLLYSLCFHALLLIFFILFGRTFPAAPKPTTEVVMVRLSRSLGSAESPLLKKTSAEGAAPALPAAPTPATPPKVETPPAPVAPAKAEKPSVPPKQEKPGVVRAPKTTKPTPAAPQVPPAKGPDEQKIADALAQVRGELEQRDAQTQAATEPSAGQGPGGPGSPFGSPGGTISAADPSLARYQSQVRSKIIREWIRTASGTEGDPLRTRVVVRINASGNVISTSFAKRSGNDSFDMSALRAVERASPLPPPPAIVMGEALSEGFVVDFSSRMLGR